MEGTKISSFDTKDYDVGDIVTGVKNGENTNFDMQSFKGKDGRSAYQLAVDNGFVGTIDKYLESLKGKQGANGTNGRDGENFHVNGTVAKLTDLPPASEHEGEWWVTYEHGHLHHAHKNEWKDIGQFVGIKGDKGDKGDGIPEGGNPNDMLTILPNGDTGWRSPKIGASSGNIFLTSTGKEESIIIDDMPFRIVFTRLTNLYAKIHLVFDKEATLLYAYKLFRTGLVRGNNDNKKFAKDAMIPLEADFYYNGVDYSTLMVYLNNKWTKIEFIGTGNGVVWSLSNVN